MRCRFRGLSDLVGCAPRIVSIFITRHDFPGKTLVAFCTAGSSGFGSSGAALREATPDADWSEADGLPQSFQWKK